jgi:hypothetical protein
MAKIAKQSINDERLRFYHLHRECVRRNAEYIELYSKKNIRGQKKNAWDVLGMISHWGFWSNDTLPDPEDRPNPLELKRLKATKTIYLPGDLHLEPDTSRAMDCAAKFMRSLAADENIEQLKGIMLLIYFPEESPSNWQMSAINSRWSKKEIIAQFNSTANMIVANRLKHGLKQEKPSERLRVEHGFDYLRAYDLRKDGNSFKEVGIKMWPGQSGDLERKARLYFSKAEKLIKEPPICQLMQKRFEMRKKI